MVHPDDVRDSLKALPETLIDAYGEIYNRIRKQGRRASQLALNAFRWLQCSCEPLRSETLLDAVTVEVDGSEEFYRKCTAVKATDLLKACQNLLILDKRLNVFRFAHLSVEEYLETQQLEVDSHTEIAKICLSLLCSPRSWTDYDISLKTRAGRYHDRHLLLYAAVFWPWHLNRCSESCQTLAALWEAFASEATFQHWIDYHYNRVNTWQSKDTFWLRSQALHQVERDCLSTVCVFGLGQKLTSISKSQSGWMACIKLKFPRTLIFESVPRGHVVRLLHSMSRIGDLDITKRLLDAGVSVLATDGDGLTALHTAAGNGHQELVRLLVERGADVSGTADYGWTPLHFAANRGHEALARLLLERGADISAATSDKRTPLHYAASSGHEVLARWLVERGADISMAAGDGWTPLHFAANLGQKALARLLVERGADISAATGDKRTPLHCAAISGHEALAWLLVERGADVSAAAGDGWTPLHFAAALGYEAVARLLVERGADISAATGDRRTPLHYAVISGHKAVAQLLVERGADVSAAAGDGWTPLHYAVNRGHKAMAQLLVDRGAAQG